MNYASARNTPTQELLAKTAEELETLAALDLEGAYQSPQLSGVLRELDRARRQFDSKLFFIVVFGPVKAGKSTLANALAGECVSPTGFGKETTRRPSFVVKAAQSGIDQYYSTDSVVNQALAQTSVEAGQARALTAAELERVHAAFNLVADYIRGVRSAEELERGCRKDTRPLTSENLEKCLTETLVQGEPLITVVRCRGGDFLDEGVAIVDMPGLDGSKSNWRDNPIHEWVIQRAEFFLFTQSSVAALNRDTQSFLQQIVNQSTKPPIWQLQNIFEACHWQPPEVQKRDADTQKAEGYQRICQLLNMKPRSSTGLNLGKAWDGKKEGRPDWLRETGFAEFEAELGKVLRDERVQIQERNSLRYLEKQLAGAEGRIRELATEIANARRSFAEQRGQWAEVEKCIRTVDYRSAWAIPVQNALRQLGDRIHQPWRDELARRFGRLREDLDRYVTGEKVNREVASVASELARAAHFDKARALPDCEKIAGQYAEAAEMRLFAGELPAGTNLKKAPAPTLDHIPDLVAPSFEAERMAEKKIEWGIIKWLDKKHEGGDVKDHLQRTERRWKERLDAAIECWIEDAVRVYFDDYCEVRRASYLAQCKTAQDECEARIEPQEEAFRKTEAFAARWKAMQTEVGPLLQAAIRENG